MSDQHDELRLNGVMAQGYGITPKSVMTDRRLSIEAKSIYAYICSFAGSGTTAFPSKSKIAADLCISEERLYNHRKQLIQYGYISVMQERNNRGVLGKTIYILEAVAIERPDGEYPSTDKPNAGEPSAENPSADEPSTDNPSYNNNSSNNNNFNNNSSKKNKRNKSGKAASTPKHKYGQYENVLLTDEELAKIQSEFPSDWKIRIERLSEYMASSGKKYQSHLATIRSWARKDAAEKKSNNQNGGNRYVNMDEEETI